jgi:hypothetical protein
MRARSIAQGGMMTAVSIVLLELGAVFEIASGAAALLAALVPALFFLRGEARTGRLVYGATSALAVLVVPDKFTALVYVLVLGLYTVLRFTVHWQSRVPRLACKASLVVFWVLLSIVVIQFGFVEELVSVSPLIAAALAAGWTVFLLYYDFCMNRIFMGMGHWLRKFH